MDRLLRRPGATRPSNYYLNGRLMRIPAGGRRGDPARRPTSTSRSAGSAWTPRGIYFSGWARRPGVTSTGSIREGGTTARAVDSPLDIGGVSWSADGARLAFNAQSGSTLPEIYTASLDGFRPVKVTAMTDQIAAWPIGTRRGRALEEPRRGRDRGRAPQAEGLRPGEAVSAVRGDSRRADGHRCAAAGARSTSIRSPQWVASGALVLRPNYRGSAGYGEKFRSLNVRNLGVGDMWDVMSGVDHLVKQGIVDTTRMGAMGWSQGGYISAFLTTNTSRFKAISMGAGISNWVTYYVATDIHPFTRQYLKATPWEDPAIYAKTSAMTTIRNARTPTLIQHGEFDRRVPIQNAYELFQGLAGPGRADATHRLQGLRPRHQQAEGAAGGGAAQLGVVREVRLGGRGWDGRE